MMNKNALLSQTIHNSSRWAVLLLAVLSLSCSAAEEPPLGKTVAPEVSKPPSIARIVASKTESERSSKETGVGDEAKAKTPSAYDTLSLQGRVVWMAEALARRHGIKSVPESEERQLALETTDGQLFPIVEDIRGRSFRRDKRLRGVEMELLVRRYKGSPMVQVINVFALEKDGKYEIDYWCEICAIAMFELKACDCCQADIVLRRRKVKE